MFGLFRAGNAALLSFLAFSPFVCGQNTVVGREPIAMASGTPIYEEDLVPLIQTPLFQLHGQEYDLRSKVLDALINQKLAEAIDLVLIFRCSSSAHRISVPCSNGQ